MSTFKLLLSITLLSNLVNRQVDDLYPKPAPAPEINFGVPKEFNLKMELL